MGGSEHGGVLVRNGFELCSKLCDARLATGALVKEPISFFRGVFPVSMLAKAKNSQVRFLRKSLGDSKNYVSSLQKIQPA